MPLIREPYGGWQYKVDLGEDRVEKRPKSDPEIASAILRSDLSFALRPRALLSELREAKRHRERSVRELKRRPIDRSLFANLEFDGDRAYQDRVTPMWQAIEGANRETVERIIDGCIDCIFESWRQGFVEESYNFTLNYGVDDAVVIIDFGELRFSKSAVREHIDQQRWLDSYSYQIMPTEYADYLHSEMERRVTVDRLERLWTDHDTA